MPAVAQPSLPKDGSASVGGIGTAAVCVAVGWFDNTLLYTALERGAWFVESFVNELQHAQAIVIVGGTEGAQQGVGLVVGEKVYNKHGEAAMRACNATGGFRAGQGLFMALS